MKLKRPLSILTILYLSLFVTIPKCMAESFDIANAIEQTKNIPSVEQVSKDFRQDDKFETYAQQQTAFTIFSRILNRMDMKAQTYRLQPPLGQENTAKLSLLRQQYALASGMTALGALCKGDNECRKLADEKFNTYQTKEFKKTVFDKYNIPNVIRNISSGLEVETKNYIIENQQISDKNKASWLRYSVGLKVLEERMSTANAAGVISFGIVLFIYGSIGLGLWFAHKRKWREVIINPKTKTRYFSSGIAVFWMLYIFVNWMNHKYDVNSPTGDAAPTLLPMLFPIGLLFFIWIKSSRIAKNPSKEEILARFGQTKDGRRTNIENYFDAKNGIINPSNSYLNVKGDLFKISARRNLAVFNHKELNALRAAVHLLNEDAYTNVDYLIRAIAIVAGEQSGQLSYSINGTEWNQMPKDTVTYPPAEILKQYLSSFGFVGTTSVVDTVLGDFLSFAKTASTSKFYLELCEKMGIGDPVNSNYGEAAYESAAD